MERRITMSRAEKFIQDYTRRCYNYSSYEPDPTPWLTPDDALSAVLIEREEIYDWLLNHNDYITANGNVTSYNMEKLVEDLKQAMK
jgi:hypothetical protein